MVKVTGLNEIAKIADKEALRKRIEKEFIQNKVDELVKQGLDKTVAKTMVKAMFECGVYHC